MPFYVWVFPNYVTQFMAMSAMLWLTVSATMPSKFWFFPMALMGPSLFYESLVYKLSKLHFWSINCKLYPTQATPWLDSLQKLVFCLHCSAMPMLTSVTETQDHMEKARKFVKEPDFAWRLSETTISFLSSVTIKTSLTQHENGNPEELLKELVQSIVGHKSLKDVTD